MTINNKSLIIGLSITILGILSLWEMFAGGGIIIFISIILIPIALVIYAFQPLHRYLYKKGGGDKKMSTLKVCLEQDDNDKRDLKFSNYETCSVCLGQYQEQNSECIGFEVVYLTGPLAEGVMIPVWICDACLSKLSDKLLKIRSALEVVNT